MRPRRDPSRLRLLGLAVLTTVAGVGSFVWALPARALAPTGSIDQPATDGASFSVNPVSFSGHFDAPVSGGVIDDISLTVTTPSKASPVGQVDFPGCGCPSQQFTWAFNAAANGKYTLTAVGVGEDRPPDGSGRLASQVSRTFFVSVGPTMPTNLQATVNDGARTVKLTWAANPEPDIFGYLVERQAPAASSYTEVTAVGPVTSYTDPQVASAPAGVYSYELIAVRRSGDGQTYLESTPSLPATATVTGPPVTTTTTTTPAGTSTGTGGTGKGTGPTIPPGGKLAPAPPLPAPTRADAGDFSHLLAQARASSVTTEPPDPGFNPRLPFSPQTTTQIINVPDAAQLASGATLGGNSGERRRLTYEYLAGGLVLFVLAMHALYLKRQVDQAIALEPLEVRFPPV